VGFRNGRWRKHDEHRRGKHDGHWSSLSPLDDDVIDDS